MLGLQYQTPPTWAEQALQDIPSLLTDHLDCEKKAVVTARSIIRIHGRRYPALVAPLQDLAREEEGHVDMVARMQPLYGPPGPHQGLNVYAHQLRKHIAATGESPLDLLLVSGLIEARSAERFLLLARAAPRTELGTFYRQFFAAEARHAGMFLELASQLFGNRAHPRARELAREEARIASTLKFSSRIH